MGLVISLIFQANFECGAVRQVERCSGEGKICLRWGKNCASKWSSKKRVFEPIATIFLKGLCRLPKKKSLHQWRLYFTEFCVGLLSKKLRRCNTLRLCGALNRSMLAVWRSQIFVLGAPLPELRPWCGSMAMHERTVSVLYAAKKPACSTCFSLHYHF